MTSEFGTVLRRFRRAAALSQEQLAEAAGLSREAIGALETGRRTRPRAETVEALSRALTLTPSQAAGLRGAVRRSDPHGGLRLPADQPGLVGRDALLDGYERFMLPDSSRTTPPVLCLHGGAGVGKSALATHLAHRLASRYSSGQLFIRLQDATGAEIEPHRALGQLLRALDVPADQLPRTVEQRATMFRARVVDLQILLVYDDAISVAQVRALLPAGAGCGVIVTSRRPLFGLEQAPRPALEPLDSGASLELLKQLTHRRTDDGVLDTIVRHCAGLPLALRIVGLRLAAAPGQADRIAATLSDDSSRLDLLTAGDLAVRRSLDLTTRAADDTSRTLLARLALLGVDDFPAWVAAPLLSTDERQGELVLERLVDLGLVQVHGLHPRPRYAMHGLVRAFAAELLANADPRETAAATAEFLRAVLRLTAHADAAIPHGLPAPIGVSRPAGPLLTAAEAEAAADPLRWFDAEHRLVVAAVELALQSRHRDLAGSLAIHADGYHTVRDEHELRLRLLTTARDAVLGGSSPELEARLEHGIFAALIRRGAEDLSTPADRSLAAALRSGNHRLIWHAHRQQGLAAMREGRFDDAREACQRAFAVLEGDRHEPSERATILRLGGMVESLLGNSAEAVRLLRQAAAIHPAGTRARAITLAELVDALVDTGAAAEAAEVLAETRAIVAGMNDEHGHAQVDRIEARLAILQGRPAEAGELLDRAAVTFTAGQAALPLHDVRLALAELDLAAGRADAARESVRGLLAEAGSRQDASAAHRCRRLLAKIEGRTP